VSVIDTATDKVIATIDVGSGPVAFGVFIGLPAVQSAPASGSRCNGVYDGTFKGNLTVSVGQDCAFLNGGEVTGDVTVVGGNFVLNGAAVDGSLTVDGGGIFTLGPAATIGGNLTVENIPPGGAGNSICGTTIGGDMTLDNNATAIRIGSADPLVCPGNKIGGSLVASRNSNSVSVFANSVGVNAIVNDNNTALLDVVGNKVRGDLQCRGNSNLIMGGDNTAKTKTGQCR
jgi:hypothetical protein